jgi:hypothetical protein
MTFARIRALIFVGLLFIIAAVAVVVTLDKDTQSKAHTGAGCPVGMVPADLVMPDHRKDIKLNVYNGTKTPGLANKVGEEFKNREFDVLKEATAPGNKVYTDVAVIRYGPKTVGRAWLLSAYFLGNADMTGFDIKRTDDVVDVIIGTGFQQLATTTEVNQSIAQLGPPQLPPGTCDAAKA